MSPHSPQNSNDGPASNPASNPATNPAMNSGAVPAVHSVSDAAAQLALTSVREIRAASAAWGDVPAVERRRRIRTHLVRTAQAATLEPADFAARVLDLLPSPCGSEVVDAAAAVPAAVQPGRGPAGSNAGSTVEGILEQLEALSDGDRRQLIGQMRSRGLLPPEPAPRIVEVQVPVQSPEPLPMRPVQAIAEPSLGDEAYLELIDGLGLYSASDRDGPPGAEELAKIEAKLAKAGFRRSAMTPDRLAVALAHFARAVGVFSEEHETNPRGLPQAIRQVFRNTSRNPVDRLKGFLAGAPGCEADALRSYVEDFFEPYRELSVRLPTLCDRLQKLAKDLDPKKFEANAPTKTWTGIAWDKVWESYRESYGQHQTKGFGMDKEKTQEWLFRQWLT